MHPATEALLGFFKFDHLNDDLKAISRPFAVLAVSLTDSLPEGPELTVSLRKLLESKDAAVRQAAIVKFGQTPLDPSTVR